MKKFTLLLMSLLMLSSLAFAQKKLCVHKLDGTKLEVLASEVSYIDFEGVATDPDDDPVVPGTSTFVAKPFSVSASKTVTFSPGNLQYHAANDEWRFAPNQTDYIGEDNASISSTHNGWIDLFGWGTGSNPTYKSTDYDDYRTFVDWGLNKIGNYAPNTWRTLTSDEWEYLHYNRPNADELIGVAQVNGVNGLILLPDGWTCPSGVTFKSGFHDDYGIEYYAAYQTFSSSEWSKLEASGAVFFSAAGSRRRFNLENVHNYGLYWSATEEYDYATGFNFSAESAGSFSASHCTGVSVRLVQDDNETLPEETFAMMFNSNGGKGCMPAIYGEKSDKETIPSSTFTRVGYNFIAWNTKANGTGIAYNPGQSITITTNLTLYAQWEEVSSIDKKLYFVNKEGWTDVKAYIWSSEDGKYNITWPGESAYKENYRINGYEVYSYDMSDKQLYDMIIFNGLATSTSTVLSQTSDLEIDYSKPYYYDGIWFSYHKGYAYVDLGLSVKWATCNVGADSPEEYGDYFAWGEITPKAIYNWDTYKWCEGSEDTQTKYCTDSDYGIVDNKTVLELSDDAANANWGGDWRMPTKVELDELRTECTWTWDEKNGVDGYTVTGPNGNNIFLPYAGVLSSSGLYPSGGFYWSSSLDTNYSYYAYDLYFEYSYIGNGNPVNSRYDGLSVRPVLSK